MSIGLALRITALILAALFIAGVFAPFGGLAVIVLILAIGTVVP